MREPTSITAMRDDGILCPAIDNVGNDKGTDEGNDRIEHLIVEIEKLEKTEELL